MGQTIATMFQGREPAGMKLPSSLRDRHNDDDDDDINLSFLARFWQLYRAIVRRLRGRARKPPPAPIYHPPINFRVYKELPYPINNNNQHCIVDVISVKEQKATSSSSTCIEEPLLQSTKIGAVDDEIQRAAVAKAEVRPPPPPLTKAIKRSRLIGAVDDEIEIKIERAAKAKGKAKAEVRPPPPPQQPLTKAIKRSRLIGAVDDEIERAAKAKAEVRPPPPPQPPLTKAIKRPKLGPYSWEKKILLVGEGDFSFSASLAVAFGDASNMIATSLDSLEFLMKNYAKAANNITELTSKSCKVIHGVDATKMARHPQLRFFKFDIVVYNFPHAGFANRQASRQDQISKHQALVKGFLKNAKKMIKEEDGQIHIAHKCTGFFLEWNLEMLGSSQGLRLVEESPFKLRRYPGYATKYGFGGDANFNCVPSKTYKFQLPSAGN